MSESILNNDSLRQIICDSLAVEFKNKTLQLKKENLKSFLLVQNFKIAFNSKCFI